MKIEIRKMFIATIITGLIERTTDAKLMKALCKVSIIFSSIHMLEIALPMYVVREMEFLRVTSNIFIKII